MQWAALAAIDFLCCAGCALADPAPAIGISIMCDAKLGRLTIKTHAFDGFEKPADPAATDIYIGALLRHPSTCNLGDHVLDVGVEGYRPGGAFGECGAWEHGNFVIRFDHRVIDRVASQDCANENQNTVTVSVAPRQGAVSSGAAFTGTDCETQLNLAPGEATPVRSKVCTKLAVPLPDHVAPPPVPAGYRMLADTNPPVCAAVLNALNNPFPPVNDPGRAGLALPPSVIPQSRNAATFQDRHFCRWHAIDVDTDGSNGLIGRPPASWAWTIVPYTNDGRSWLVNQSRGFPQSWQLDGSKPLKRDWSDPQSYTDLQQTMMAPAGACSRAGDPLDFPIFSTPARVVAGRNCTPQDMVRLPPDGRAAAGLAWTQSGAGGAIEFFSLNGSIHVLYPQPVAGYAELHGTFDSAPKAEGGLGPYAAIFRVLRFGGNDYRDECVIGTGPLP